MEGSPLTAKELHKVDGYWRASLYLSLGMLSWRIAISSLNLLTTSSVWRQDHKGLTDQDPGVPEIVLNIAMGVIDCVPHLKVAGAPCQGAFRERADCLLQLSYAHGIDKPEILAWKRPFDYSQLNLEQTPLLYNPNGNTRN